MARIPRIRFLGTSESTSPQYFHIPKILVREPRLMVPRQKPTGRVKVDSTNSLSAGLTAYWVFNRAHGTRELISSTEMASGGGPGSLISYGNEVGMNGEATSSINISNMGISGTGPRTVVCEVIRISSAGVANEYLYLPGAFSGDGTAWRLWYRSGYDYWRGEVIGYALDWSAPNPVLGSRYFTSFSASGAGGTWKLHMDGILRASATAYSYNTTDSAFYFGGGDYSTRWIMLNMAVFKRFLSDEEHLRFYRDPYQFLIPA